MDKMRASIQTALQRGGLSDIASKATDEFAASYIKTLGTSEPSPHDAIGAAFLMLQDKGVDAEFATYVAAVIIGLILHANQRDVSAQGLTVLASTVTVAPIQSAVFIASLPHMLPTVYGHVEHAEVAEHGCALLCRLCVGNVGIKKVCLGAGAERFARDALRMHRLESVVISNACAALANLCGDSAETLGGSIDGITIAAIAEVAGAKETWQHACNALSNIAVFSRNHAAIIDSGGVQFAITCLGKESTDGDPPVPALRLLAHMYNCNNKCETTMAVVRRIMIDFHGFDAVNRAIASFANVKDIAMCGASVLGRFFTDSIGNVDRSLTNLADQAVTVTRIMFCTFPDAGDLALNLIHVLHQAALSYVESIRFLDNEAFSSKLTALLQKCHKDPVLAEALIQMTHRIYVANESVAKRLSDKGVFTLLTEFLQKVLSPN